MINSRTDCHALSKEVVNHCDLIHHSRLAEIEQIIYYLKKRKLQSGGKSKIIVNFYFHACRQNIFAHTFLVFEIILALFQEFFFFGILKK